MSCNCLSPAASPARDGSSGSRDRCTGKRQRDERRENELLQLHCFPFGLRLLVPNERRRDVEGEGGDGGSRFASRFNHLLSLRVIVISARVSFHGSPSCSVIEIHSQIPLVSLLSCVSLFLLLSFRCWRRWQERSEPKETARPSSIHGTRSSRQRQDERRSGGLHSGRVRPSMYSKHMSALFSGQDQQETRSDVRFCEFCQSP